VRLARAPAAYASAAFDQILASLEAAFKGVHKRGEDVELAAGRLILTDRVTGDRYQVVIDSGVLDVEAMP